MRLSNICAILWFLQWNDLQIARPSIFILEMRIKLGYIPQKDLQVARPSSKKKVSLFVALAEKNMLHEILHLK